MDDRKLAMLRQAVASTDYFVMLWDADGQVFQLSRGARQLSGLAADDDGPLPTVEQVLGPDADGAWHQTLRSARRWQGEWSLAGADGEAVPVAVTARAHGQGPAWFSAVGHDLRRQRRIEQRLRARADYDGLTGAFARAPFLAGFARELERTRRYGRQGAFLFLDIDDFKRVNDTLGHPSGDRMLAEIVHRWQEIMRESDTLGRLGGDEFGMLLVETGEEGARRVAQACVEIVRSMEIGGPDGRIQLGGSVGVVLFPAHGDETEELVARADGAMFRAKAAGGGIAVYRPGDEGNPRWVSWATELETALEEERFRIYAQPIHHSQDRSIAGYELYLRLRAPGGQILDPGAFLSGAERSGFVRRLDYWVMKAALQLLPGLPEPLHLSVNLSENTLRVPQLVQDLADLLAGHGVAPARLQLEIPGNGLLASAQGLADLAELGVRLTLDEREGISQSPWKALAQMPLDVIKVNAVLSDDGRASSQAGRVLGGLVRLARDVGVEVCAKGVADAATYRQARDAGCAFVQGYHLGRPEPVEDLFGHGMQ